MFSQSITDKKGVTMPGQYICTKCGCYVWQDQKSHVCNSGLPALGMTYTLNPTPADPALLAVLNRIATALEKIAEKMKP
jgi:hypothetical protein